jgi:hypothetical protein
MTLRLRTLLDYLDDTLEPAQTKEVGQQVAEDANVQELISRIKQVTRRRRLTTPPAGDNHPRFEPQTVAAYLDGSLPEEEAREIEKICLDSDVHLAELASCHQILTLSMGEPALVPPRAMERMYGLVKGKETVRRRIPSRRRREMVPNGAATDGVADINMSPLGLPEIDHQAGWVKWALPLSAAVLLLGLGVLMWPKLSSMFEDPYSQQAHLNRPRNGRNADSTEGHSSRSSDSDSKAPGSSSESSEGSGSASVSNGSGSNGKVPGSSPLNVKAWIDEPSERRAVAGKVGQAERGTRQMLVRRPAEAAGAQPADSWERVTAEAPAIHTGDTLVALPGFRSNLVLDKGVDLYLWGNVPPFFIPWPVLESAVVLHDNPDYDLDFTLLRGRVVLTNRKPDAPARVRVRFYDEKKDKEAWDVTLQPKTEIGLDRVSRHDQEEEYDSRNGTPPTILLMLVPFRGEATVQLDEFQPPRTVTPASGLQWDSVFGRTDQLPIDENTLRFWNKIMPATPQSRAVQDAMTAFEKDVAKPLNLAAREAVEAPSRESRYFGIYCLSAIDNLPGLIDALGDSKDNTDKCDAAYLAIKNWLGRNGAADQRFYDALLKKHKFKEDDAQLVMKLLHGISRARRQDPATWKELIALLLDPRPVMNYLAYQQLYQWVPQGRVIPYNPAGGTVQKEEAVKKWKELIPERKLPPPEPASR